MEKEPPIIDVRWLYETMAPYLLYQLFENTSVLKEFRLHLVFNLLRLFGNWKSVRLF